MTLLDPIVETVRANAQCASCGAALNDSEVCYMVREIDGVVCWRHVRTGPTTIRRHRSRS